MAALREDIGLRKLLEVWVDSDLKAQIIVFFENNPGVIDTLPGLATRLGTTSEALSKAISSHIDLGFLHKKKVGSHVVLVYDRNRHEDIQKFIQEELAKLEREASA